MQLLSQLGASSNLGAPKFIVGEAFGDKSVHHASIVACKQLLMSHKEGSHFTRYS